MPNQFLVTKLYIPPLHQGLVPRPQLVAKLDTALNYRITAIVAPAGFGKTTLLVEWINRAKFPVAWISLDKDDNDSVSVLSYLIASLQVVSPHFGETILPALNSADGPPIKSLLATLINQLSSSFQKLVLVLDDFHWIEDESTLNALTYLVNYLPAHVHLVLASRSALPSSFARLRACGDLLEINATELRFTTEEAALFLHSLLGNRIAPNDIALLERATEGWVAGLQMAAISCQNAKDIHQTITRFSGDDRYIADYLIAQVLAVQSEPIQHFLLHTSVLDRMCASLCNAVVDMADSQTILEFLDRMNLFIVPLDNHGKWYRYHHLFAELLRTRLQRIQPENYLDRSRRASAWFQQQGDLSEAIEYALRAQDYEHASNLIEQIVAEILSTGMAVKILAWLARVPDQVVCRHPRLALSRVWLFVHASRTPMAEQWFEKIKPLLQSCCDHNASDEREIAGLMATMEGVFALYRGEARAAIDYHQRALTLLSGEHEIWRIVNWVNLGFAQRSEEEYASAKQTLTRATQACLNLGSIFFAVVALSSLAQLELEEGHLGLATETCQRALGLVPPEQIGEYPILVPTLIILGQVFYEQSKLDTARKYFDDAIAMATEHRRTMDLLDGLFYRARIHRATGDSVAALTTLEQITQVLPAANMSLLLRQVSRAYQAHLWLTNGHLAEAETCCPHPDEMFAPLETEIKTLYQTQHTSFVIARNLRFYSPVRIQLTLARLYLAQEKFAEAQTLLTELTAWLTPKNRKRYLLEVLILQVQACHCLGNSAQALTHLYQALELARHEKFMQVFIDEGASLRTLLALAHNQSSTQDRLLDAFIVRVLKHLPPDEASTSVPSIRETLTPREADVLRHLNDGLSYAAIADRLSISDNTVRTYIKNIYGKLAVNNRVQAIHAARQYGYLV